MIRIVCRTETLIEDYRLTEVKSLSSLVYAYTAILATLVYFCLHISWLLSFIDKYLHTYIHTYLGTYNLSD